MAMAMAMVMVMRFSSSLFVFSFRFFLPECVRYAWCAFSSVRFLSVPYFSLNVRSIIHRKFVEKVEATSKQIRSLARSLAHSTSGINARMPHSTRKKAVVPSAVSGARLRWPDSTLRISLASESAFVSTLARATNS